MATRRSGSVPFEVAAAVVTTPPMWLPGPASSGTVIVNGTSADSPGSRLIVS